MRSRVRVGIDYGTSNTVSAVHLPGSRTRILLFDGAPQLASAVCVDPVSGLLTGGDATHSATVDPARVELNPKRRIDDGAVLLGEAEVPTVELIAATLRRVRHEAERVCGGNLDEVVLTHPASWGPRRRGLLVAAAAEAGLPAVTLVAEPVAAAAYFVAVHAARIPHGQCVVVYDFGAGTFDASVVQHRPGGFAVLATEGLPDVGGLDVDAAIVSYLRGAHPGDPALWQRLTEPATPADRRARAALWDEARAIKLRLSRAPAAFGHLPLLDADVPLGREEYDRLIRPILDQTVAATVRAVRSAGVSDTAVGGVFLVGGSSRIPLVATLLHRALSISPTLLDQPELVVAEGALHAVPSPVGSFGSLAPAPSTQPPPAPLPPISSPAPVPPPPVPLASVPPPPVPLASVPLAPVPVAPGAGPARRRRTGVLLAACLVTLLAVGGTGGYLAWSELNPGSVGAKPSQRSSTVATPLRGPSSARAGSGAGAGTGAGPAATSNRSAGTSPREGTFPVAFAGVWSGQIRQSDGPQWPIKVTIVAGTAVGAVAYARPGCGGSLTVVGVAGQTVEVHEQITEGRERCTDEGTVTLTLDAEQRLVFDYVSGERPYTATGVLSRTSG